MAITSSIAYYNYINDSIKANKNNKNLNINQNYFTSKYIPDITIIQYIERLFDNILIPNENINIVILHSIALLNYMKKYGIYLTEYTAHRLILISLLLATKIYDDIPKLNSCWALYGGITLDDINLLEKRALYCLKFNLFISYQHILSIQKSIY